MAGSEYYDHTTYPSQGAAGSSAAMRSELDSVENGFGKLPGLAGNGGKIVVVNAGGTALEATSTPALGAATGTSFNGVTITPVAAAVLTLFNGSTLATSGAFSLTLTATAATNVTLPTTGTLATLAGAETLTNKTLTSPTISSPTGITATNISNTPAGGIAATTVQAALNELDAEKAKSGANSDITSLSAITSINGGPIGGSRNRLINGNFGINQLVVSGTVTLAAGAYGHDGWKAGASGCTYTFAASNNVTTLTISAGSLIQVADGQNLQSGTHVLSWSGTAQGRIDGGIYGASGAVTATAVGGTNMTCEWGTGTLSLTQLEKGSLASRFDFRDDEQRRCQRYYRTSYNGVAAGSASATGGEDVISQQANRPFKFVTFDEAMRATPAVTTYNPTTGATSQCDFGGSGVTLTMGEVTPKGFSLFAAGSPGTHGGYFHYTAAARL